MTVRILEGDCIEILPSLPDASVHCVVTSPPYWRQRDYEHGRQIGMEESPEEYVSALVSAFSDVRRTLVPNVTVWINLGEK